MKLHRKSLQEHKHVHDLTGVKLNFGSCIECAGLFPEEKCTSVSASSLDHTNTHTRTRTHTHTHTHTLKRSLCKACISSCSQTHKAQQHVMLIQPCIRYTNGHISAIEKHPLHHPPTHTNPHTHTHTRTNTHIQTLILTHTHTHTHARLLYQQGDRVPTTSVFINQV